MQAVALALLSSASAIFFSLIAGDTKLREDFPTTAIPLVVDEEEEEDDVLLLSLVAVLVVELDLLLPNSAALFCVRLIPCKLNKVKLKCWRVEWKKVRVLKNSQITDRGFGKKSEFTQINQWGFKFNILYKPIGFEEFIHTNQQGF